MPTHASELMAPPPAPQETTAQARVPSELIIFGAGNQLAILSVVVLSPTTMRVTFNRAVLNNAALRNAGNYRTLPALQIISAVPDAGTPTISVVLTTSEMADGVHYALTIDLVEAA